MNESDFQKELKRICGLKQNKGKSEDELMPLARINLLVREFRATPIFTNEDEQKIAEERYKNYLVNNEIEGDSDLDTLRSLIYAEVFERRIQKELNKLNDNGGYPPEKLTKQLIEVQNQKAELKIKLGIDSKDAENDLTALQRLQKRVEKHINENKGDYSLGLGFQCEKCGHKNWESFLVYHLMKDKKFVKHPWFAGRHLFNYEILKDVKNGKISKEDAWRYMLCSGEGTFYKPDEEDHDYCVDYIDWCLDNWTEMTDLIKKK